MVDVSGFSLISVRGRPLILLPQGPRRVRLAAIACFPVYTRKRLLFQWVLRSFVRWGFNVGSAVKDQIDQISPVMISQWIDFLKRNAKKELLFPVFVWPGDPHRGRIYAFLLDDLGEVHAFAKMALDSRNVELIRNEASVLRFFNDNPRPGLLVPQVIAFADAGQHATLLVEAVRGGKPGMCPPASLDALLRVIQGRPIFISRTEVQACRWWQRFKSQAEVPKKFLDAVEHSLLDEINVCQVHGDLNRTNLVTSSQGIYVLDWECSHPMGPYLTDQITILLDVLWPLLQRNSEKAVAKFRAIHWDQQEQGHRNAVVLALVFLYGAGFTPSIKLIDAWFGK